MIYALVGALVVGLSLGIFGSGGSILTVPVLLYLLQHEDKVAIAESLAIVGAIALVGALPYAKDKLVEWRTALLFGVPGMIGTYLGAWIAAFVAGYVQLFVFAAVMLFAGFMMWRSARRTAPAQGKGEAESVEASRGKQRSILKIGADGLAVGVLTGFVGVGGGFLIVPALVLLGGLPMRRAVGTSLVIIAMKSATGYVKYLDVLDGLGLTVDWSTIGVFSAVGMVGSFVGKAISGRLNQSVLKKGFAVFLGVMAVFIVVREAAELTTAETAADRSAEPASAINSTGG